MRLFKNQITWSYILKRKISIVFFKKLKDIDSIRYVHELKEQPWGQRVIRLYDPDMHIIEIGEPMQSVVKRLLSKGLSVEETVKKTLMPEEFVKQFI